MLQNYTMSIYKTVLMNTRLFQMLKKESWVINMIQLIYFLKYIIMISGLRMKNPLIRQEFVNLSDMPPLGGDQEVKEGKGLNILTPIANKLLTRLPILLA